MNGLFEGKPEIKEWLRKTLPQLTRGGGLALFSIVLFCGLMLGSMIGYSSGKQDGYHSGFMEGNSLSCPPPSSPSSETLMNFSAFLDWAGKVELPPMGWALLILLALVIIK